MIIISHLYFPDLVNILTLAITALMGIARVLLEFTKIIKFLEMEIKYSPRPTSTKIISLGAWPIILVTESVAKDQLKIVFAIETMLWLKALPFVPTPKV